MTRGPLSIIPPQEGVGAGRPRPDCTADCQGRGQGHVTGTLGDAPWRSSHLLGQSSTLQREPAGGRERAPRPSPSPHSWPDGPRELASNALGLSDGLASDLSHILKASGVRAQDRSQSAAPLPGAAGCSAEHGCLATGTGRVAMTTSLPCPRNIAAPLDTALANCGVKFHPHRPHPCRGGWHRLPAGRTNPRGGCTSRAGTTSHDVCSR